jgi:hypothetical protein
MGTWGRDIEICAHPWATSSGDISAKSLFFHKRNDVDRFVAVTIPQEQHVPLFIRRVMPNATDDELHAATETFWRVIKIIIGIQEDADGVDNDSQTRDS